MGNDGKIYITISDERSTNAGSKDISQIQATGGASKKEDGNQSAESSALGGYAKYQFFSFIGNEAQNIVNYSLNNIGNFTGNYQQQADVNLALSTIGSIANIGNAAIQGALIGGPVGAVIGATIGLGFMAINFGLSEKSNHLALNKMNENIAQLKERSGNNVLLDGSRGTLY